MAEFASKGLGVTGTTLGAIALGLTLTGANGCGGGLLGNVLGGNCQQSAISALQAENAALKAENYSDKVGKEVYAQTLADNKDFRNEVFAFVKPIADEAANNRVEVARLQEKLDCCCKTQELREQIVMGKINEVALTTSNGLTALAGTVNCLKGTVDAITKVGVPQSALCQQYMPLYNSWTAPTAGAPTNTNIANAGAFAS